MATPPTPHPHLPQFLRTLTAPLGPGWGHVLSHRPPGQPLRRAADQLVGPGNIDWATDTATRLAATGDVYIGAACMTDHQFSEVRSLGSGKRGGARHIGALVALWADIDITGPGHASNTLPRTFAEAGRIIARLPDPTMIVHTGGGIHAWWALTEPHLIDGGDPHPGITDRWVRAVAGHAHDEGGWLIDAGVGDLPRVLRPAGTLNHKTDPPLEVRLILNLDRRHSIDQLAATIDTAPPLPAPDPPPRPATSSSGAVRANSGGGPGVLRAVDALTWDRIWPPAWDYTGTETVDGTVVELWRRPGATTPHSAKCWPHGGAHIWSDQIPGLPAGPASKADVMAWRFGCNISDLARELARQARQRQRNAR